MKLLLLILLLGAEPISPDVDSLIDVDGVCRIAPDWTMHRAVENQGKSCEEYAAVLTDKLMTFTGLNADYFPYAVLCWLMDPCSKVQP